MSSAIKRPTAPLREAAELVSLDLPFHLRRDDASAATRVVQALGGADKLAYSCATDSDTMLLQLGTAADGADAADTKREHLASSSVVGDRARTAAGRSSTRQR